MSSAPLSLCTDDKVRLTALGSVCDGRHIDHEVSVGETGWFVAGLSAVDTHTRPTRLGRERGGRRGGEEGGGGVRGGGGERRGRWSKNDSWD